jgi:hypothetical protein
VAVNGAPLFNYGLLNAGVKATLDRASSLTLTMRRPSNLSVLATAATGQAVDYVAEGLRQAQLPPSFFAQPGAWSPTQA